MDYDIRCKLEDLLSDSVSAVLCYDFDEHKLKLSQLIMTTIFHILYFRLCCKFLKDNEIYVLYTLVYTSTLCMEFTRRIMLFNKMARY